MKTKKLTQLQGCALACATINLRPALASIRFQDGTATATNSFALHHVKEYKHPRNETVILATNKGANKTGIDLVLNDAQEPYPDWKRIIPTECMFEVKLWKKQIQQILSYLTTESTLVYVDFDNLTVTYGYVNNHPGQFDTVILGNALQFILTSTSAGPNAVTVRVNHERPVVFETSDLLALVMPNAQR